MGGAEVGFERRSYKSENLDVGRLVQDKVGYRLEREGRHMAQAETDEFGLRGKDTDSEVLSRKV